MPAAVPAVAEAQFDGPGAAVVGAGAQAAQQKILLEVSVRHGLAAAAAAEAVVPWLER